jgi:hypothetical protein
MMINWREIPFVRLFLPFALGIVAAENGFVLPIFWINLIACLSILCIIFLAFRRTEFRHLWFFGGPLSIFLFCSVYSPFFIETN